MPGPLNTRCVCVWVPQAELPVHWHYEASYYFNLFYGANGPLCLTQLEVTIISVFNVPTPVQAVLMLQYSTHSGDP